MLALAASWGMADALAQDSRIQDIRYSPDAVVAITGQVGYATTVFFHPEETVESVAIGDDAWHVAPERNRISLKPRGDEPYPAAGPGVSESDTNMTVWTDRRVYFFELRTAQPSNAQDRIYAVRFRYPRESESRAREAAGRHRVAGRAMLDTGTQEVLDAARSAPADVSPQGAGQHWNYSWSGSASLRPASAFDDGRFTYLRFADGAPLPAIYIGEEDGTESIANLHVRGHWVVIHRLASRFVLRDGGLVACVFRDEASGT